MESCPPGRTPADCPNFSPEDQDYCPHCGFAYEEE